MHGAFVDIKFVLHTRARARYAVVASRRLVTFIIEACNSCALALSVGAGNVKFQVKPATRRIWESIFELAACTTSTQKRPI